MERKTGARAAADFADHRGPRASVIIPHYRQLDLLGLCLASLERQTLPRDSFEIVVVDNNSPIEREDIAAVVGDRARLVTETEQGAGPARNRGVAETSAPILAFIDADCVADPRWLAEGIAALERFDLAGGSVTVSVLDEANMTGAEAFERVFAFDTRHYIEKQRFTISGNLFTRRDIFAKVGGFRTGVSEDLDWCLRAAALGFRIGYHAAASISHPARRDWSELKRKWVRISRESYLLTSEKPLGKLRWLARSYAVALSVAPHGLKLLASDKLATPGARLRGLVTLVRLRLWRFADAHRLLLRGARP